MGQPINFEGANILFKAPPDHPEVLPMQFQAGVDPDSNVPCLIGCWQMTPYEIEEFNRNGGKVFYKVWGKSIAPHNISTEKQPILELTPENIKNTTP